MITIEYLRQFKFEGYAIFDLLISFLGMYILAPHLSRLFLKYKIVIPKINWVFLTLPVSIAVHLISGNITPMTKNFFDIHSNYILKALVIFMFYLSIRNIKKIKEE